MTNELFGAHYFNTSEPSVYESNTDQLYYFQAYIGYHEIKVDKGDCAYYFDYELGNAIVEKGTLYN